MELEIIKSGRWAKHHAWGPVVDIVKGETYTDDDDDFCQRLIDADYAKVKSIIIPLKLTTKGELQMIVANADTTKDAKLALESWGKENAGIDVNRAKSVKNIIRDILAAYNG